MRRAAATALLAAVALGGCGNHRQQPPNVTTPGPPLGALPERYPKAGIAFTAPAGWQVAPGQAPLITTVATGRAQLNIYRYVRSEPLPSSPAQLDAATDLLLSAFKARDSTWTLIKKARLTVDGRPAVQVRGSETVAGQPRIVRSTHIYGDGAEVVVDAFAPEQDFRRVDAQTFRGVLRSLKLGPPAK